MHIVESATMVVIIMLGVPKVDKTKCCYCGACISVCPANCISLKETRIEIDEGKCIKCSACIRMCPAGAMDDGSMADRQAAVMEESDD